MQITKLFIKKYKIFENFEIDFQKYISIVIGINGSGKSTILESIAQIFSDAFRNEKTKFQFKLEYELRLEEILEQTSMTSDFKTDYIKVEIFNKKENSNQEYIVNGRKLKREEIAEIYGSFERILPSNIVIYYSGQSHIMERVCEPFNKELSFNLRSEDKHLDRPFLYYEPKLFGTILLSLLSYEFGDVPGFLLKIAKIKNVVSVKIKLRKPKWARKKINEFWGAEGEVELLLRFLDSLEEPLHLAPVEYSKSGNVVMEAWEDTALNITILGGEMIYSIREYFVEEKRFFEILNTLIIDGFQPEFSFTFKNNDDAKFIHLSEGEQQLIIAKGLIELSGRENTLFLFDEPDTYLHPSWQRKYIELIKNNISEDNTSHFIITTHSPQLLSNSDNKYSEVKIVENAKVLNYTPNYYGKDISTILYELMNVEERIPEVTKMLTELFGLIENENLNDSKKKYDELVKLLGTDDPELINAKIQIDYLESDLNEENK
ncbi:Predicted ATP-binding protein involved in virulence [Cruoricaptor ignavus]|uniref:Predicted ATP-binding protein involved in virulence n=1 Tax=Cruoricaptor ignavus TaxID=1118202 RepID=A0A1M6E751_9FLAO|nr:ATP-binding protein [Cruoricaptor ignavus]SHI81281.1 Predicted ATP-binding protein involved in virulence [Cruoricaptor ignavus]